jgi:hypothetical protein
LIGVLNQTPSRRGPAPPVLRHYQEKAA